MNKNYFSLLLLLLAMGQTAWAKDVTFISRSWDETNKTTVNTEVTRDASPIVSTPDWVGLTDGYYYVEGDISVKTIKIMGTDVNIILCNGSQLSCSGGIKLEGNTLLRIFCQSYEANLMGKLDVRNSYSGAAGIGCSKNCVDDAGNIVGSGSLELHGGDTNIVGDDAAAGVGGGTNRGIGGYVTIYGGNHHIVGSEAAGIGGGDDGDQGGPVTIYGGYTYAVGCDGGSGIGGGRYGLGGKVTIYGGVVRCEGSSGIGTGKMNESGDAGLACDVLIAGGKVNVFGRYGAGIGGSFYPGGKVTITGGIVEAEGQWGAGIGGGEDHSGTILITGGQITAKDAYGYSAGIGGGDGGDCQDVTITGGEVYAYAVWMRQPSAAARAATASASSSRAAPSTLWVKTMVQASEQARMAMSTTSR